MLTKTVLEHHRFISSILAQAEKELLVPYNAAAKATPPKVRKRKVNYFEPDTIKEILAAFDQEPIRNRNRSAYESISCLVLAHAGRGKVRTAPPERPRFPSQRRKRLDLRRGRSSLGISQTWTQSGQYYDKHLCSHNEQS